MEIANIAVNFLGSGLIILALGLILCLLGFICHTIYIKYQDKHKKIEFHTQNVKSKNESDE